MNRLPAALGLIGIGWYFATCVVVGVLGGLWLDERLQTAPVLALLGILLGLAVAGWGAYRMLLNVLRPRPPR